MSKQIKRAVSLLLAFILFMYGALYPVKAYAPTIAFEETYTSDVVEQNSEITEQMISVPVAGISAMSIPTLTEFETIQTNTQEEEEYNIPEYQEFDAPSNTGFKSWMPYTAITNKNSSQYRLQIEYAYTDEFGLRKVNDRYCVALGSYFGVSIGQYFDLVLDNDTIILCIMGDQKADIHTDSMNIMSSNGCMSEFLIDYDCLVQRIKSSGTVSSVEEDWDSPIKYVRIYEDNILE